MDVFFWDEVCGGYFSLVVGDMYLVFWLKDDYDGVELMVSLVVVMNFFWFLVILVEGEMLRECGVVMIVGLCE